jgi:hypothetical protein
MPTEQEIVDEEVFILCKWCPHGEGKCPGPCREYTEIISKPRDQAEAEDGNRS